MSKKLKPYMAYSNSLGAREGACLVFAYSAKQAKKMAYPTINDWFDIEWTDCCVKWLNNRDWLFEEKQKDEPHVVENPKVCSVCETWGNEIIENGVCIECIDENISISMPYE